MSPLFPHNIAIRLAYQKQNIEWGEWSSLVCPETWCETSQSAWKGWVNPCNQDVMINGGTYGFERLL